jgi:hypothetical protein
VKEKKKNLKSKPYNTNQVYEKSKPNNIIWKKKKKKKKKKNRLESDITWMKRAEQVCLGESKSEGGCMSGGVVGES